MVYECEKCNVPLPPGVRACPNCGEAFDDVVPADAEVPQRGFRPSNASAGSTQYQAPTPPMPQPPNPIPVYAAPATTTPALARGWVMVLTFLFCFPLFIIGVWQRPDWSRGAKALATVAFVIMLCIIAGINNATSNNTSPSSSSAPLMPTQHSPSSAKYSPPAAPDTAPSPAPDASDTESKPDLEVIDHKSVSEEYGRSVVGTVRNNTDHNYGYAQVEINLYDKSGSQVGSTVANINNLAPHSLWKFKAPILEDSAVRFEIKDVTGF